MDSGLKKTVQSIKKGTPIWAKWLMGGVSAAGFATVAGIVWWNLKNKNPQVLDEANKEQQNKIIFVGLRDLNSTGKLNKTFKTFTYNDVLSRFQKEILINGRPVSIKLVENEQKPIINGFKNLILEEFSDSKVVQCDIEFSGNNVFSIFLFGNKRVAFHRISSSMLFECEEPIAI